MKVVIAGGGTGGLVAALCLHREGIKAEIYEQSDHIQERSGVGINLLPPAVHALSELGLHPELYAYGRQVDELVYARATGEEIMRLPRGRQVDPSIAQISIRRGALQEILHRAVDRRLGSDAVHLGSRVVDFAQNAGAGVHATVLEGGANVSTVAGDVLIGADGVRSAIRRQMYPNEGPPQWGGIMIMRGMADWPAFGTGHTMVIAGGTPAKFIAYPVGHGATVGTLRTNWAIGVQTGRPGDPAPVSYGWRHDADRDEVNGYLERFNLSNYFDHGGLVKATARIATFPLTDRDPLSAWSQGRVTLLGDAAHPMYPNGGIGAWQAIMDAVSLAGHLRRHVAPADALLAYEQERRPATRELTLQNRQAGPEQVIDIAERGEKVDPAELRKIVDSWAQRSGANA